MTGKRIRIMIAALAAAAILAACGSDNNKQEDGKNNVTAGSTATEEASEDAAEGSTEKAVEETDESSISVDKGLMNVEVNISKDYAEYMGMTFETQEEADEYAKKNGFAGVTKNDDGSYTIKMSKAKHKELMDNLKKSFDEDLEKTVESENYPNFKKIETNDDYTEFKITTSSESLDFNESFSVLGFYMYGGLYNALNGTPVDNVHVDFINESSGEIIESYDSRDMDTGDGDQEKDEEPSVDYVSQLETEEYSYESYGSSYHFVIIRNNSDQTLTVKTNSVAFDADENKIGACEVTLMALGAGKEQCAIEYFDNVTGVDHFSTSLTASESEMYEDGTGNIEVETSVLEDKAILTCTNNGEKAVQGLEGFVLFMKDGTCVGYDTQYFMDEESQLKAGASMTKQFNIYDVSFDDIRYFLSGTTVR